MSFFFILLVITTVSFVAWHVAKANSEGKMEIVFYEGRYYVTWKWFGTKRKYLTKATALEPCMENFTRFRKVSFATFDEANEIGRKIQDADEERLRVKRAKDKVVTRPIESPETGVRIIRGADGTPLGVYDSRGEYIDLFNKEI